MGEMYKDAFADEEETVFLPEDEKYRSSFKKRIVFSVLFTALAVAFSFFSIIDPEIENTLMPMHIPVLLGSFACGGPLGFLIGFLSPLIKFFISGHASPFSDVLCSCFELALCGCLSGYLFRSMPRKLPFYALNVAISLIVSKTAFFILKYFIAIFTNDTNLAPDVFISQRFGMTLIGVAFQIITVPLVVVIFRKTKIAFE